MVFHDPCGQSSRVPLRPGTVGVRTCLHHAARKTFHQRRIRLSNINLDETLCVDKFFNSNNPKIQKTKEGVVESISWMRGPDEAKLLTALATDIVTGILNRNDRPDVRAAVASLHASLAALQAIDANLDG